MTRDDLAALRGQQDDTVLHRLVAWLRKCWRRVADQSELDQFSSVEVERLARDIGVSTDDLERLARRDGSASLLLDECLRVLGLDSGTLERDGSMRDLRRTCGLCDAQGVCRHDLGERPDADDWLNYCPNSQVLCELEKQADEHRHRAAQAKR